MDDRKEINIAYELREVHISSLVQGVRMELLDLIDYANKHNGMVELSHLYEELNGLRKLSNYYTAKTLDALGENFEDNVNLWKNKNR